MIFLIEFLMQGFLIGSFVPSNSLAYIVNFSDRVATFAPQITLDFILEWSVGFSSATPLQKITCLQYVSPWIRNLGAFVEPTSTVFDESGAKVRDCIHVFVDLTMQDPEVYGYSIHLSPHDAHMLPGLPSRPANRLGGVQQADSFSA